MEDKSLERRLLILESMITDIYDTVTPPEKDKLCPVCGERVRLYLPVLRSNGSNVFARDIMCPVCSSYNRHRAYALFLNMMGNILDGKDKIKVLHFAPEKCFYQKFSKMQNVDYYPVDIDSNRKEIRDVVDITNIPYVDDSFDFIMCTHVLEHVQDDKKGMSEMYRVLKQGGHALINVPIDESREHTFENPEYNTPELKEKYYGHADHVRSYGRDYSDLLRNVGFIVNEVTPFKDMDKSFLRKNGVFSWEKIHHCIK